MGPGTPGEKKGVCVYVCAREHARARALRSKGLISLGGKGLVPWELGAQPAWLTGA